MSQFQVSILNEVSIMARQKKSPLKMVNNNIMNVKIIEKNVLKNINIDKILHISGIESIL